MKKRIYKKPYKIILLLFVFGLGIYFLFNSRFSSTDSLQCESGKFANVTSTEFLNINQTEDEFDFVNKAKDAIATARTEIDDYELNSVLITTGFLPRNSHSLNFSLVSVIEQTNATYSKNQIIHESTDEFAKNRYVITEESLEQIMSPFEAVQVAIPFLNCHKDYNKNITHSVKLMYSDQDKVLVWIIRAEDMTMSIPGPNVSHMVKLDAYTGEIVEHW